MPPEEIQDACNRLRMMIRGFGEEVRDLRQHDFFIGESDGVADYSEMKSNIMLAYRHLEDARMRLGKVIQAKDGGVSVYDK